MCPSNHHLCCGVGNVNSWFHTSKMLPRPRLPSPIVAIPYRIEGSRRLHERILTAALPINLAGVS